MNLHGEKNELTVDTEIMALEKFLVEAEEQENNGEQIDRTFAEAFDYEIDKEVVGEVEKRLISAGEELDSSDDEEIKNFLERKYNEYGSDINKKLKQRNQAVKESKADYEINKFLREDKNNITSQSDKTLSMHIKNPHDPIKRQSFLSDSFKKLSQPIPKLNISGSQERNSLAAKGVGSSVYTDPVFGFRIINPLVSSTLLSERMNGRKLVGFSAVAFHTQRGDLSKDWVIAGVIVHKSPVQKSKTNQPFSIWRLSDLKGEIKTLSLFIFSGAYKDLRKTAQGMCIAVLNPTIFEKRSDSKDVCCISIDTAKKVMVLGQSKDFGSCKATKRNGEVCNAIINVSVCNTCIFHMKQEFGNMSRRSELQSSNAGRGLNDLRNKILGKSEVFYGGQTFSAIPARKSAKLIQKDSSRINLLSEYAGSVIHSSKPESMRVSKVPFAYRESPVPKIAGNVEASTKQRLKDLERLKTLRAVSENSELNNLANEKITPTNLQASSLSLKLLLPSVSMVSNSSSKTFSPSVLTPSSIPAVREQFGNHEFSFASTSKSPRLCRDNFCVEVSIADRKAQMAKIKALEVLKNNPIQKANPNSTRGSRDGKRRAIDKLNEHFMPPDFKKQKIEDDQKDDRRTRIQRIMEAASSHSNLIGMRERQEQEKYFSKLEKKEALEEKLLNTYKMPCKAVICKICKYTAFCASERCKEEHHPLKVIDNEKRFFQCKDCGYRTVSLFKFPKISCKNCQGSRWERCAMIRERKVCDGFENLSLRGDEEMFIGSISGKANLNLTVSNE